MKTNQAQLRLEALYPETTGRRAEIERFTADYIRSGNIKQVTVPIIVHVVYASEEEKVSEAQIFSQIEALNRDFGKKAYRIQHPADTLEGFSGKARDTKISFCLAEIEGKKKYSIHYQPTKNRNWTYDNAIKSSSTGGVDPIDTDMFLNIWVANLADSVSGYAQMPGGPAQTDGIVIDYQYFGTLGTARPPYNEGKTLTHLVGNYLNLYPLWGPARCVDDKVEDTPIHNGPNYRCPYYEHVSICGLTREVEMIMNFMDNTYDECMYMFTEGQMRRMQATLSRGGPREELTKTKVQCDQKPKINSHLEQPVSQSDWDLLFKDEPDFIIYPNPTKKTAYLAVFSPAATEATVTAFSSIGKQIFLRKLTLSEGVQELTVDCKGWPPGVYFTVLTIGQAKIRKRLIISGE